MMETTVEKEIVQINYWKEMRKEIDRIINDLHGLVLLTHNSIEFSDVIDFLNKVKKDEQSTVLYISLINSYEHIKKTLEEKPLPNKKLFVVDCVSGFLIEIQDSINCIYRKPPRNLNEMKELIIKTLHMTNPNIIVVDSLSQFINFSRPKEKHIYDLYRFLKSIKEDVLGLSCNTIILLYDDKTGLMKELPTLSTDIVLKLEIIKEDAQ
jgi:hypothetical protein